MMNLWKHVRTVVDRQGVDKKTLVSLIDSEGNLYCVNEEMQKMLAIAPTDRNKNIFEFLQKSNADKLRKLVKSSVTSEKSSSQLQFQNGSSHLVSLDVHAVPAEESGKQYFVCFGKEISDRRAQQSKIFDREGSGNSFKNLAADQQGIFLSAMDNSPALSWMIDEEERLVYANKAYKKFFSLPAEAIGQDIKKHIPPAVIKSLYGKHIDSFYANKPVTSTEKAFLADGTCLQFRVMLFPSWNSLGGKVIVGQAILLPPQQDPIPVLTQLDAAIDRNELRAELSETIMHVLEKERSCIGYELHDNINQILTTVHLFIGQMQLNTAEQENLKVKSMEYLVNAIEEIRSLSRGLVTPRLKEKGLVESLREMIEDLSVAGKIAFSFNCDKEAEQLNPGKKLTLYRVAQEQLKNVCKYSGASAVIIGITYSDGQVILGITDNGKGFDPAQTTRGIGLSSIYERTRFYGGSVDIETSPGKGCMLTVRLPAD